MPLTAMQLLAVFESVVRLSCNNLALHVQTCHLSLSAHVHKTLSGVSLCLTLCRSMTAGQKKRDAFQEVTPENAGQTLFTRCERETLVRFPKTQAILFTIRTYIRNLAWYAARPNECATLADALRNLPEDLVSHHMFFFFFESPHDLPRLTKACKKAWQNHMVCMQ
jgi:hypothetical protein